ncbi:MAG: FeoB-associated Cys-rich membrane protein [Lachnospiraceae bacterium]|nr:FeoB-associated Cys-rich membrane protein [Lachnospiraceae bacterium]
MGTIVVGLIVLGITALAVRSMIRDKKAGKSLQCGGDCSHCKGHCH